MVTKYTFICEEIDDDTKFVKKTTKEFMTDDDTWTGDDGPMYNFFLFLKGIGFLFSPSDVIGVMKVKENGEEVFKSATLEEYE